METKKSSRRQMATLLCSLGAIVIGGVAADAWAAVTTRNDGRWCWMCETGAPLDCTLDSPNVTDAHECPEGYHANCSDQIGGDGTYQLIDNCVRDRTGLDPL